MEKRGVSSGDNNPQIHRCADPIGPGERIDPFTKFGPSSWWMGRLGTLLVTGC